MKKLIKAIIILIGCVILTIYCLPLPAGIINEGNIFGIAVGIIIIIIGIKLDKIIALWKKKIGKAIISIVCVFAIIGTGIFAYTLNSVINCKSELVDDDETVIVLGCQVYGETASRPLRARAERGAEFLRENKNAVAILCGGQGNGESISEAECMKRIMLENGIDEKRLYLEDKSTSTEENINFASDIILQNKLSTDVVIISSDYHCERAKMIAKRNGFLASCIPVKTNKYSYITFCTREVFGIWVQQLKLYLS